jgi:AcrR family transcriptional regulator
MKNAVQTREVRDAILDATDDFLARFGYKKMTIENLAQQVGIGKGSVYLHFTSKEEIALSHIDRIIERLVRELKIIAEQKISPEEKMRQMLLKRVLHRFDSVRNYTQSLNDLLSAVRPKLLVRRKTYFETEARIFAKVIEEGQKSKIFADGNAPEIAETFLLATNSLLPFSLTARELGERNEIEEKTLRVTNLLLEGLIKVRNEK